MIDYLVHNETQDSIKPIVLLKNQYSHDWGKAI